MQTNEALRDELMLLERRYWNALKDGDAKTAMALSDDPCVVVGASGVSEIDNATLGKMMDGATYELKDFIIEDVHVRRLSDDLAALAYKVKEDLVVDGEKVTLDAYDASVWQRRKGGWVCVLHTESPAGDAFGRD
jgi:hypothetical protein